MSYSTPVRIGWQMPRLTPNLGRHMTNEGQMIDLPDGRRLRFIWSGLVAETGTIILTRNMNKTLNVAFCCHRCNSEFRQGKLYYNRKASGAYRRSRFYCLDCAETLGFVEFVRPSQLTKLDNPDSQGQVTRT